MPDLKQYTTGARSASELARGVEGAVAAGAISPGERLPSVRRLAADVGLSPATVSAALAELRRRGVVVSEQRRGTRIGEGGPVGARRVAVPLPPGARDLAAGNPDIRMLPDLARAFAAAGIEQRLYGPPAALPELLALASDAFTADGVPAEHVCVVSGALDGIERALRAHLRPGDRVAVEDPGYAALLDTLRAQNLLARPVPVDEEGLSPSGLDRALAAGARAVVLTPRGQNPTGAATTPGRARALRDVLGGHASVLLVEDDHLGPVADASLQTAAGGPGPWCAIRSVAKALGPDLRLAVLAGDAQTVARVQAAQQCGPGWVSHVLQRVVQALWSDPEVAESCAHAAEVYGRRRRALLERLRELGVAARGRSGLNVWIPVADEAAVVAALLQRGWAVAPGAPYRVGDSAPAIRVTTAALEEQEAAELASDLAAVLNASELSRSG